MNINYEQIAHVVHEANRAFCKTIGDNSQVPWEEAPKWQKDSAITVVEDIMTEKVSGPEQTHETWVEAKITDGWKFGPIKDADKKEHPCLVPYDQLPEEQKKKDDIFFGICIAFMV